MMDDLADEALARQSYSEEQRHEAEKLIDDIAELLHNKEASLVMNVITSLLVCLYMDHYGHLGLQYLLDKVSHNYRLRTAPDGVTRQ